jgi:hypothetical protein
VGIGHQERFEPLVLLVGRTDDLDVAANDLVISLTS